MPTTQKVIITMNSTVISKKNKKRYSVPVLEVFIIETSDVIAGSQTIEKGSTDGNGHGEFTADAKRNLWLWDEEDILSENMEDDDWSYTYKAE